MKCQGQMTSRWLCLPLLGWALGGCAESGFECGREVPGNSGTFRRCDRSNEVCICYTNSCARRVAVTPDGGLPSSQPSPSSAPEAKVDTCPTGLEYVDAPFAHKDLKGQCVPQAHLDLSGELGIKSFADGELVCPGAPTTPRSSGGSGGSSAEPAPDDASPPVTAPENSGGDAGDGSLIDASTEAGANP
jgi:hypothetical protein